MRITHQANSYEFPEEALGGTKSAPLLKPADELLLEWLSGRPVAGPLAIYHDQFAILDTVVKGRPDRAFVSNSIVHHNRRKESHVVNGSALVGESGPYPVIAPAAAPELALMHLPKNLDLFEWYLHDLARHRGETLELAVGFLTRHFTPRLLEIAGRYASSIEQSRAYKKARTLVISDWKERPTEMLPTHPAEYRDKTYHQHFGVFSAGHIDYATQFLLDTWRNDDQLRGLPIPNTILDVGVGNGVILDQLHRDFYPEAKLIGTDVSHVAIASAKLNAPAGAELRWQSDLSGIGSGSIDLAVTNPPFHEGHRNTIGPTLALFKMVAKKLALGGHFVVVANRHLNYATHLERIFGDVREVANNEKFVVYLSKSVL